MKTRDLFGRALDYAVALAEGVTVIGNFPGLAYIPKGKRSHYKWAPSTGRLGDDIIDREKIGTEWVWSIDEPCWQAWIAAHSVARFKACDGATRREAAMRAYVASKLGDSIDIPKELE